MRVYFYTRDTYIRNRGRSRINARDVHKHVKVGAAARISAFRMEGTDIFRDAANVPQLLRPSFDTKDASELGKTSVSLTWASVKYLSPEKRFLSR